LEFIVDLEFIIPKTTLLHGICSWFDTYFKGCNKDITLSTSPYNSPTHWYQIRLLLPEPIAVNKGQRGIIIELYLVVGKLLFKVNKLQSYYIFLRIGLPELNIWVENCYDLKDPEFRIFQQNFMKK
jgi:histone-arginine methyltransferase CARM1